MHLLWRIPHSSSFAWAQRHYVSCSICKFDCDLIIYRLTHVARGLSKLWFVCAPLPLLNCPALTLCLCAPSRMAFPRRQFFVSHCNDEQLHCSILLLCQVHLIKRSASSYSFNTHLQSVTASFRQLWEVSLFMGGFLFFLHAISNDSLCSCWHCRWQ